MSQAPLSRKDRRKARIGGSVIAHFIGAIGATLRFELSDPEGLADRPPSGPMIWAFWHDRVFTAPVVFRKFLPQRHGSVLTSPSGDGEVIVEVLGRFGVGAIRGSSNKRASASLREMVRYLKSGKNDDLVITPDGPRGPHRVVAPGLVKVAQITGAPIFPISLTYSRAWQLHTWDKFEIPWPFSRVAVHFHPLLQVPRDLSDEGIDEIRERLREKLNAPS